MVKGAVNTVADDEFLLCCIEASQDMNIDFSIVSKATGYATDWGARARLRKIKAKVRSLIDKPVQASDGDQGGETESKNTATSKITDDASAPPPQPGRGRRKKVVQVLEGSKN
ncbi:hypothetical protein Dda_3967 [Drechslerella dactyloides]|uniref:Myb-like DNA-binding domain-containing protein n=1 Tax=Drechslerella dactyloides TaxID=74499 RepID=A0AAD6IYV8_DREDA|nr:hypothetical protein Dda_3967 [Drechslerella dactyloides]